MKIRCSSLDMLFACPASVLGEGDRIKATHPAAILGTATHEPLAAMVEGGECDITDVCARHGIPEEVGDVASLVQYGRLVWDKYLSPHFPGPMTERSIVGELNNNVTGEANDDHTLTGTMDVVSTSDPAKVAFLDWKSGYLDNYHHQLTGYAYCLWDYLGRPGDVEITGVAVFLRQRFFRVIKYDAASLDTWARGLTNNVLPSQEKRRPGSHCNFCELRYVCTAKATILQATLQGLGLAMYDDASDENKAQWNEGLKKLASMSPEAAQDPGVQEVVNEILFRSKLAAQQLKDVDALLRQAVRDAGEGGIPLDSHGTILKLTEQVRRKLNPVLALPVLRRHISSTQIARSMSLKLSDLKAAKSSMYKRGEKGAAIDVMMGDLEDAGAIEEKTFERLEQISSEGAEDVETDDDTE